MPGSTQLVYQNGPSESAGTGRGPDLSRGEAESIRYAGYVRVVDPSGPGASVPLHRPGIVPESAEPTRYLSAEWFESRNSFVRSVEVSRLKPLTCGLRSTADSGLRRLVTETRIHGRRLKAP